MLGINALATHMTNPAARTGDGEKIVAFNRRARRIIGDDPYGVYRMDKMGAEVYMGRWARLDLDEAADPRAGAERADVPWLITCDRGLVEMGLSLGPLEDLEVETVRRRLAEADIDPASVALAGDAEEARARIGRRAYRCRHGQRAGLHVVLPEMLGQVVVTGRPVRSQRWGRAYLIRLGDR
jgi:hypothetical protein